MTKDIRDRMTALLTRDGAADEEVDHVARDSLSQAALRLVVRDPNNRDNWETARLAVQMLDHTEDWQRWYA